MLAVALKVTSCRTMSKIKKWEKSEKPRFMGKIIFFLRTMPFSPWRVLVTWLHVGTPQKIHDK
jgi:hypothetical protein